VGPLGAFWGGSSRQDFFISIAVVGWQRLRWSCAPAAGQKKQSSMWCIPDAPSDPLAGEVDKIF